MKPNRWIRETLRAAENNRTGVVRPYIPTAKRYRDGERCLANACQANCLILLQSGPRYIVIKPKAEFRVIVSPPARPEPSAGRNS